MTLWVARAGRYGERESFALENNAVVVGWDDVPDLSEIEGREQLLKLLTDTYPDENPKKIKNWEAQLWAFVRRFRKDDLVALPLKTQSAIAFGRIVEDYRYASDAPSEARHQRPVEWINTDIARSRLDSDLLYSLGGAMTVFSVRRNNAEARVRALLEGKTTPDSVMLRQTANEEEDTVPPIVDIQQQTDDQIVDFISRKFKGHELTRLVEGVLKAQGYTVRVSSPGADGGVDIVAGRGPMGFEAPRLCVQVKSGDDAVDVTVLRELQGVMKNYRAEQGLIVSWGGFKSTVHREARQLFFEIRLWNQADLVKTIQETYENLPDELQAELPMKRIWTLVIEDI